MLRRRGRSRFKRFSVSPLIAFAPCSAQVDGNGLGVRSEVEWKARAKAEAEAEAKKARAVGHQAQQGNPIKWDKRKMFGILPGSWWTARTKGRKGVGLFVPGQKAAQRRRGEWW